MWFKFGDSLVRFSMEEFCLITGLGFEGEDSRSKYDARYCRLKHEYFTHLPSILPSDVRQAFVNMSNSSDRDVVNIGILYLITSIMLVTSYKRSVEDSLMVIVDSDECNTYAWGKVLFRTTISSLKSALKNKSLIVEGDGKPYMPYRISGFLIAFQVWIYETVPILEGKICSKVLNLRLRILNWTSFVQPTCSKLNLGKDIFSRPDLQVNGIEFTLEERMEPYFSGLNDDIHVPQVNGSDDDFVYPSKKSLHRPELKHCIVEPIMSCSIHQSPTKGTHTKLRKTVLDVVTQNLPVPQEHETRG
ncbi:Uncharacterized protein Adt_18310 [Abeliophyllum distichum]|uniref:DUF1985 domain-containing protein n=1 Tax=Abeliophyllum distichum TaxID=126358 RepID=A0ABD1TJ11_9LAMI